MNLAATFNNEEKINALWHKRPLIISGPCSAETELQVINTAKLLKQTGKVDILRAGIWKPRTKPGMFEGVGEQGLAWLQSAQAITGLPFTLEAATAKQVETALKYNPAILWIGARTTANPFSVQEVADALKGVEIPVMIKNPTNPDIELWCGAVERISNAGIKKIGLIHRGFSSYGNKEFRNAPLWQIAIEMKLRYPSLLFINDPSHICGRTDTLQPIMQRAVDLNYDGFIIESHYSPKEAWSDSQQQITPDRLNEILDNIIWRKETTDGTDCNLALENIRQNIGSIDDEVLQLLATRMNLVDTIGELKRDNNITILQSSRWMKNIAKAVDVGAKLGLNKDFVQAFMEAIHIESINRQKKIMDKKS